MKKEIIIVFVILALFFVGLFIFMQSGQQDLSSVAGTYEGKYTKFVNDPDTAKNVSNHFAIELRENGTGTHNRDNSSFEVTWSLDKDKFSMSEEFAGEPIEYTGTLKDGKLDIFNGDPSNSLTCEYVYEKN